MLLPQWLVVAQKGLGNLNPSQRLLSFMVKDSEFVGNGRLLVQHLPRVMMAPGHDMACSHECVAALGGYHKPCRPSKRGVVELRLQEQ